jgi:biotin carboxylase
MPVRAILPGLEYSVEAAAVAAELQGLPGGGPAAARILRDKLSLRQTCRAAGLPTPRFAEVTSADDLARFAAGGACVLKPANRQASLGVLLLDAGDDAAAAWRECVEADEGVQMAHRPMRWRYLAEARLTGPEYSVEALVRRGEVVYANVTRKQVRPGRHPIERGHLVPAPGGPGVDALPELMAELMAALVAAVGFDTGLLHAEWIVTGGQPVLIECAGRPPGDWIMDLITLTQDIDLYAAAERVLAGEPPELSRGSGTTAPYAAVEFLVPHRTGRVADVVGGDAAAAPSGVCRVPLLREPGDAITSLDSSWCRLAAVIATGPDPVTAEAAASNGLAQIKVTLE